MAQYNAIKAAVNAYIKANGRKEITGQILNSVLNASIDSLGKYFQFAGEARPDTDPGTPDQNVTYLAGVPGTYTNFGGLVVDQQEIALLMWDGEWRKHTMLIGIQEVEASVDNQVGTPSVDVNYANGHLDLAFHNLKGEQGNAAGFGSVSADVDANIGTPGVSVVTSGDNTAKNFTFHFTNLKGQKGDTGVTSVNASIDNNTGVPYVEASISGQILTLAFHNMKGQQGDTGSSVDYPYTLVNNVTTDDATQGLSAAMGVYLQEEITRLDAEVDGMIRDNSDADFSVSDENGMAIVQFKNGHIKTKNFDSSNISQDVATDDIADADLEIQDESENVLARFSGGNFRTKNFDSSYIGDVISRYNGKRFSLLGDSISTFGTPSATNQDGTYCYSYYPNASCRYSEDGVDSIEFDVEDTYWMRLVKKTGMKLGINDSYRGTKVSGTTNAFNLQTRIDHLGLNGTPDVILVYGGTNDAGAGVEIGTFNTENPQNYTDAQIAALPVTTFADAYRAMLIRLMKTYPLAEIVVVLPTFTTSYYTITNLDLYVEIIKEACDFFGIKYIDARCTGINVYNRATFLVDGIHPNKVGMELLFKKIYRNLIFN